MARAGIKQAISLIGRKIGEGTRGGLHRSFRAGAHLIAGKTSGGSVGQMRQRAAHAVANAIGGLSPGRGLHARKFAPVVLLAVVLAESAHAPLVKGAKAMSWNLPVAPSVQSPAGDAGQPANKKFDLHGPAGATDQPRRERPVKISPDYKLWDQPAMSADPSTPQEPISLIHDHGGATIDFGPTNGGGGSSDVTPIVHGAVYDSGGGGGNGTGGGGAGGAGGGAGGGGDGSGPTPTVLSPTQEIAVPEPASVVWMLSIGALLRRRRR